MTGPLETETLEASMAAAMTSHTDHQQELPVPRRTIGNAKDSLALRDTTRNHPPPQRKTAAHHVGVGSSRRPAARDSLMVRGKNAHETKQLAKEALRQIVAEEEDDDGFNFDDDSSVQEEVKPQEEPDKDKNEDPKEKPQEENAHPLAKLFQKSFGEDEKKEPQEAPEGSAADDSQEKEAPHSDDAVAGEEEEEEDDPAGSQPPAEKRVQFGQVHIHEHAIILGDNPACSEGVPITIDWPCLRVLVRDAQEYDDKKNQQQEQPPSSSSSSARHQETRARALQQGEQHRGAQEEDDDDAFGEEEACKKDARSLGTTAVSTSSAGTANRRSLLELKIPPRVRERLVRENQGLSHRDVVRMCRPVNVSRHQRLRTVETLQLAPLEQAFQQAKKKFQKPFLSQQERQERQRLKSWRRPSVSGGGAGLHQTCKPIVLDVSNTTRSTLKDDDEDLDTDLTEVPQEA